MKHNGRPIDFNRPAWTHENLERLYDLATWKLRRLFSPDVPNRFQSRAEALEALQSPALRLTWAARLNGLS